MHCTLANPTLSQKSNNVSSQILPISTLLVHFQSLLEPEMYETCFGQLGFSVLNINLEICIGGHVTLPSI